MQPGLDGQVNVPEFGIRLDGTDYIARPGVYVVLEDHAGQIAVIENGTGYFLPGGGMEPGETEVEALRREVREEIGCQVLALTVIGDAIEYLQARSDGKYYRVDSRFYKARMGVNVGEGTEENHRLVWMRQTDALRLLTRQSQVWAIQNLA
jgi:8-oxo-dGTP diphosphatase